MPPQVRIVPGYKPDRPSFLSRSSPRLRSALWALILDPPRSGSECVAAELWLWQVAEKNCPLFHEAMDIYKAFHDELTLTITGSNYTEFASLSRREIRAFKLVKFTFLKPEIDRNEAFYNAYQNYAHQANATLIILDFQQFDNQTNLTPHINRVINDILLGLQRPRYALEKLILKLPPVEPTSAPTSNKASSNLQDRAGLFPHWKERFGTVALLDRVVPFGHDEVWFLDFSKGSG